MSKPFVFIHQLRCLNGQIDPHSESPQLTHAKELYHAYLCERGHYAYQGILLDAGDLDAFCQKTYAKSVKHIYIYGDENPGSIEGLKTDADVVFLHGSLDEALEEIGRECDVLLCEGSDDFQHRMIEEGWCDEISTIIPSVYTGYTPTGYQAEAIDLHLVEACILDRDILWIRYMFEKH